MQHLQFIQCLTEFTNLSLGFKKIVENGKFPILTCKEILICSLKVSKEFPHNVQGLCLTTERRAPHTLRGFAGRGAVGGPRGARISLLAVRHGVEWDQGITISERNARLPRAC